MQSLALVHPNGYLNESPTTSQAMSSFFALIQQRGSTENNTNVVPETPVSNKKRKVGRPAGTVGTREMRDYLRSFREADEIVDLVGPCSEGQAKGVLVQASSDSGAVGSFFQKQLLNFAHQQSNADVPPDAVSLVNPAVELFSSGNAVSSLAAQASSSSAGGRDYRQIATDQARVACALVGTSGAMWGRFLHTIASLIESGEYEPLAIMKMRRYDETSLKVRVHEQPHPTPMRPDSRQVESTSAPSKIFQTEFKISFLVQRKSDGAMLQFIGRVPTWLQNVDCCTAQTVLAVQKSLEDVVPNLEEIQKAFPLRVSMPCTDRHASNIAAENLLQLERPGWQKIHTFCSVHRVSTCTKSTLSLVDGHISGVLAIGQCLQFAGSTQTLRKLLYEIIQEKLVVRYGEPTSVKHREFIYNMFLNSDVSTIRSQRVHKYLRKKQRYILNALLNGDIQQDGVVLHYCVPLRERSAVLADIHRFAIPALLPHRCPRVNRGSFLGHEAAICWVGLIESHHGLLQPLLFKFCGYRPIPPAPKPSAGFASWARALKNSAFSQSNPDTEVGAVGLALVEAQPHDSGQHDQVDENLTWAELNRATKRKAALYIASSPGPTLVVLQWGLAPLQRLMMDYIFLSSKKWDATQNKASINGERRSFRLLELLMGKQTQRFFQTLRHMFHTAPEHVPVRALKLSFQALCFRLLSRAGCSVETLVVDVHRSCPYKLFGILCGKVAEVLETPQCMQDGLMQAFMGQFPTFGEIVSKRSIAMLSSLAEVAQVDILTIEARHSATRRLVHVKSTQTWALQFSQLSAEWTIRQHVCESEGFERPEAETHQNKNRDQKKKKPPRVKKGRSLQKGRGGFGGAWRAFLHLEYSGKLVPGQRSRIDFKAAAKRYADLKSQGGRRWQDLVEFGNLLSLARKRGLDPLKFRKLVVTEAPQTQEPPASCVAEPESLQTQIKTSMAHWREQSLAIKDKADKEENNLQLALSNNAIAARSGLSNCFEAFGSNLRDLLAPGQGNLPDVITLQVPAQTAVEDIGLERNGGLAGD